jgi:hypothetical protein
VFGGKKTKGPKKIAKSGYILFRIEYHVMLNLRYHVSTWS